MLNKDNDTKALLGSKMLFLSIRIKAAKLAKPIFKILMFEFIEINQLIIIFSPRKEHFRKQTSYLHSTKLVLLDTPFLWI